MRPYLASICFLVAVASISQVLVACPFADGQTASAVQSVQQSSANENPQSRNQSSQAPVKVVRPKNWPNNIVDYKAFFEWINTEDLRIQQKTKDGNQQIARRIDYSSVIGISSDKVEAMLAIILDADRRRAENGKQWQDADNTFEIAKQRGTDQELGLTRPDHQAVTSANGEILYGTWATLKETLGEEDFQKLDAYVNREFAMGPCPASVYPPKQKAEASTLPPNFKYEMFINRVVDDDRHVQRAIQAGDETQNHRMDFSLAAGFPENKEEPMLAIVRKAKLRLNEKDEEIKTIGDDFVRKYGRFYKLQKPYPPDLQAMDQEIQQIARERDAIIEDTNDELKQEIGDDAFNRLDAWITRNYGPGRVSSYPTSDCSNPGQITQTPNAAQTQGAQP